MRPKVAVDICNTLADINKILKSLGYDTESYGGVPNDFFENNLWVFSEAEPIKYSKECLCKLAESCDIVYLTARPKVAESVTREWLLKNGFPYGELVFSANKAKDFKENQCIFAIDDAPFEVENYRKSDCLVMVPKQPYNNTLGDVFKWEEWANVLQVS
ncbi:MAG: hypothetical protein E7252_10580 [Lachnospira sp.]|nr:hypothetical protein [Lachnospira sp.]